MVYVLAVKPRFLYVTAKQLQRMVYNKHHIANFARNLSTHQIPHNVKRITTTTSRDYKKKVALVSGVIIIGSFISFSHSDYYNLDTIPTVAKPIEKNSTPDGKRMFSTSTSSLLQNPTSKQGIYLLTEDQVSEKLRQFEESYLVNRGRGVTRYDICQLASNSPIEDDRAEEIVQVQLLQDNNIRASTDWMFFGVFDGHGGWTTSSKLRDKLIGYVIHELGTIFKSVKSGDTEEEVRLIPNSATIDQAIKNGFLKLDHELVNENIAKLLNENNKAKAAELLMPALSGSCALVSFYDTHSKILKVAVTGDSRAILGSFRDNQWTVRQLSIDQTGSNPTEVARIISEHPDEPKVIKNGRVLGSLEPTRAFGDCRYKLPGSIQEKIYKQFFGKKLPNFLTSPPYVTAEPVITSTKVDPDNNDFLVMASDGLYEMLTNEEIVGLVVKWMEKEKMIKPQTSIWDIFGTNENKLPQVADITNDKSSKKPPQGRRFNSSGLFLLEDKNVSTHLIRNALSNGGSKEQTSMLISIPSPVSRRYRDDLTVTVVFFGKDQKGEDDNGRLEVNVEATGGGGGNAKPKL